jgi:CubicO group peptidase (beta-lactamase class C family)
VTLVAPGLEGVAAEFERSLDGQGAAFAATVDGELVVDLWGGPADDEAERPWREDTATVIFSGAKGLVATCVLLLLERSRLDLDEPVRTYWPELADARVLVRHVMSHTAGLPGFRRSTVSLDDIRDYELMTRRLEQEDPYWPPGSRLAYHALTYGWLAGELVRRTDGRTVGRFLAEEIAEPLGLDLWIGLPAELEPRVARLRRAADYVPAITPDADPLVATVYANPDFLTGERFVWNDPAYHRAEIPGANAIATARSVAQLYGVLACGGGELLREETVALGRTELARAPCALTGYPYAFGVGFELQTEVRAFGPPEDAFGHTGAGGSAHGAWPSLRVGFSYATNELRSYETDTRARRLLAALHEAVR